ncbi:MAG: hypothetical protein ACRD8O_22605, partial [Bryobacteraceae bacterium]
FAPFTYGVPMFVHIELLVFVGGNGFYPSTVSGYASLDGIGVFTRVQRDDFFWDFRKVPEGAYYTLVETPEPGTFAVLTGSVLFALFFHRRVKQSHAIDLPLD